MRISDWSSDVCSSDLDQIDTRNVQTARGDVGRHQHRQLARLEVLKQAQTLALRDVAGQHARLEAIQAQALLDELGTALGVDEYQRAEWIAATQQADQERQFLVVGEMHAFLDPTKCEEGREGQEGD